jgi:nucleoside-diphosphate-sugar epimerase
VTIEEERLRIVIFGASGQTGRLVARRALDAGHTAVTVTRNPQGFPFADPRLEVAGADVRDASSLADVVDSADAVLSTLGVPFTTRRIDTYSVGIRNTIAAMRKSSVQRLVVVSSTGAYHYPNRVDSPFALRIVEPIITRTIGKTTYDDQRRMETIVRDSGLDWTIVRPSGLFDLPTVTEYVAGEVVPVGGFTSRTDLADYLVRLAGRSGRHDTVTISTTTDTPTMWQMVRREAFKSA